MADKHASYETGYRQGVIWVSGLSALAFVIGYFRNWFFANIDSSGEVLGYFVLIQMYLHFLSVVASFGGASSINYFLPGFQQQENKRAFVFSSAVIVAMQSVVAFAVVLLAPGIFERIIGFEVSQDILFICALVALLAGVRVYFDNLFSASKAFLLSSLLGNSQVFVMTAFAAYVWLWHADWLVEHVQVSVLSVSLLCLGLGCLWGIGFVKKRSLILFQWYLPEGYWSFSAIAYLQSLLVFAYVGLDRIFIAKYVGLEALGGYFIFFSIAQLATFVVRMSGRVFLASYSSHEMKSSDGSVTHFLNSQKAFAVLGSSVSLLLLSCCMPVGYMFGEWTKNHTEYYILLVAISNIGSVGPLNANYLLSHGKKYAYLMTSLFVVGTQFLVLWISVEEYQVSGVVFSKAISIIVGQLALFYFLRLLLGRGEKVLQREYWISQLIVGICALIMLLIPVSYLYLKSAIPILALGILLACLGIRLSDIREFISVNLSRYFRRSHE